MAASADVDSVEPVELDLQSQAPLGEVFSAARNAKNMTQQDVSNSLRFSVKQIDALENNAFAALPNAMITRGFIRNYARLLELDAEPLLASYRGRVPDKLPNTLVVQTSVQQVELTKDSLPWLKYILGGILVLLFLLAWFFYMDDLSKQANAPAGQMPEATVEAKPAVEVPLPEIALPAAERQVDSSANSDVQLPPDSNQKANLTLQPSNPIVSNAATDSSAKKVSMSFSEKTWVSVTDKSGKVIFEKMGSAGSIDSFDGTPPFNLLIGNAKATKLTFLGQEVDLAAHTSRNVARVRLE